MAADAHASGPTELSMLECRLDPEGMRAQRDRYRELGRHTTGAERDTGRLAVDFEPGIDDDLVAETVAVERECCPFFGLAYEAEARRLVVTVADRRHDPALDAIAYSLGVGSP